MTMQPADDGYRILPGARKFVSPNYLVGPERVKSPLPTRAPWNATRAVTVLMLLSFLMFVIDRDVFKEGLDKARVETTEDFIKRYGAWAFLYVVLIAGADFDATRELSLAFALLIFISVVFIVPSAKDPNQILGAQVFNQLATLFQTNPRTSPNNPNET